MKESSYPVIDLFAGPGGLGEGFAALPAGKKKKTFRTLISIEKDDFAYETLLLRHFFRSFENRAVPKDYYNYLAGELSKEELRQRYPQNWEEASRSALKIALGKKTHKKVENIIRERLAGTEKWVLVGGPPCQAYSLAGRSRMKDNPDFEEDERHFLYKEYLKIIAIHRPPVFVMENVKGLLSSKVKGQPIIQAIVKDLTLPKKAVSNKENGLRYRLYSLSQKGEIEDTIDPSSFVVRAEDYGVPQARHRIFIVGIRSDIDVEPETLKKWDTPSPTVRQVIGDLPRIRSGVSKAADSPEAWRDIISSVTRMQWYKNCAKSHPSLISVLGRHLDRLHKSPARRMGTKYTAPQEMSSWFVDKRLKGISSHEARSHMETDLHRYLFASAYAEALKTSPKLSDFPDALLPMHRNVHNGTEVPIFSDRFRVQLADSVSSTITSHISKDGHYFIHYDPSQCRSLTVREAARLQTFPDNYHFEGPRTAQYHQVGNAVPPYLARQIARIIKDVLDKVPERCNG